jgi:homoserine O-succinyltransferase
MTVILPKSYHTLPTLKRRNVPWKTHEDALREDIRALRIGILNIMPEAETYEFNLLQPLGYSVIQIEPVWIRLKTHTYGSTSQAHLDDLYVLFQDSIDRARLDGLIITGAPVEEIPFEQITYWHEILRILRYARKNIASTLGLCWAGLAIAKFLGLESIHYNKKIFGVFQTHNLDSTHAVTGGMDDVFWCPQSRHSGLADDVMEKARDEGVVTLLAYAEKGGHTIFESTDRRFLVHLGHPEYQCRRLIAEYERDRKKGREDVAAPENFDMNDPHNRWRSHRSEFYSQWIKYIHESTTY